MRSRALCFLFLAVFSSAAFAQSRNWEDVELSGIYVFGHATNTITPCSRARPIWLDGVGKGADDLHKAYDSSVGARFDPLYVVVRGRLDAEFDIGDYYLGWFDIAELVEYSAEPDVISKCQSQAKTE